MLEGTGYMARAAFIMDRMMSKVGLHGRAFIPLLSSFACAIPGIMATRTIKNPKDRLITILVAPLMTCSARMPVYVLIISAFIPNNPVFGPIREIAEAVGDRCTLILDSGVRRGSDIVKALALGAKAVLTGRATLYGTAVGGEAGALKAINILKNEADKTMAYTGCCSVDEVTTDIFYGAQGGNRMGDRVIA